MTILFYAGFALHFLFTFNGKRRISILHNGT